MDKAGEFDPMVSIIIPVYNGANYLREAIDSALAQTYRNIEVIVVNDGSTDGGRTEEIARSYGARIRYLSKENGGVASALNAGIRAMRGQYFSWLSHDDVYLADKVRKQVLFLGTRTNRERAVPYGDFELIDAASRSITTVTVEPGLLGNIFVTILSGSIHGCSLLIPKACFADAGLFNERLKTTQDGEMWLRMAQQGCTFVHMPEVLIRSRMHAEQGSRRLSHVHQKEKDEYYGWALQFIGNERDRIFTDLSRLLLHQRFYRVHDELVRLTQKSFMRILYYRLLRLFSRVVHLGQDSFLALVRRVKW